MLQAFTHQPVYLCLLSLIKLLPHSDQIITMPRHGKQMPLSSPGLSMHSLKGASPASWLFLLECKELFSFLVIHLVSSSHSPKKSSRPKPRPFPACWGLIWMFRMTPSQVHELRTGLDRAFSSLARLPQNPLQVEILRLK